MQFLILGYLILVVTDFSPYQLGLVIFLYGVPNLSFMLFGGIFADRVDRRRLLVTTQAAVTAVILGLATMTMTMPDLLEIWHIYAAVFILGILQALNLPARMAIVTDLVEREDIMNAVALSSAVMNAGRIIGPAVAGGVIALVAGDIIELEDIGPALYFNAGCYFVGVVCLLSIRGVPQLQVPREATMLRDFVAGLRYFWLAPVALTVIGIGWSFSFFGMPHIQVMPAFAEEVLEAGPGGAGLLLMAGGLGSLLGSLVLASLGNFQHKNWLLLVAFLTFDLTLFLFAWSPWYWVSWVILFFVGMGGMGYVSLTTMVLQLTVPSDMQGRVLSLWAIGAALMYVGALPMGAVAGVVNWPVAVAVGAAISLALNLWLGVWRPTLRHLGV